MLTLISIWLTERIVTVFTVLLVAVASVPTTLLIVSENGTMEIQRQQQEKIKTVLLQSLKVEGQVVVAKLQAAETTCNTQVQQLITTANAPAPKAQEALVMASGQLKTVVTPLVVSVAQVEDEFAHLTLVTPEDRDDFVTKLNLILVKGVGDGHTTGVIIITCQTVLIEVQRIIVVIIHRHHGEDDDAD